MQPHEDEAEATAGQDAAGSEPPSPAAARRPRARTEGRAPGLDELDAEGELLARGSGELHRDEVAAAFGAADRGHAGQVHRDEVAAALGAADRGAAREVTPDDGGEDAGADHHRARSGDRGAFDGGVHARGEIGDPGRGDARPARRDRHQGPEPDRVEGLRAAVLVFARARLAPLSADDAAAITALSDETALTELVDTLGQAASVDEARAVLDAALAGTRGDPAEPGDGSPAARPAAASPPLERK